MHSKTTNNDTIQFPPILVARLTGKLGDKKTIERISSNFAQIYNKFLPIVFKEDVGIDMSASYIECKSGKFSHIINSFKEYFVFYKASLKESQSDFFVGCSNNLVITILEYLLDTDDDISKTSQNRCLSIIEQKLAELILTKTSTIMNKFILKSTNALNPLDGPYNIDLLKQGIHPLSNEFVSAINIEITVKNIVSLFTLIVTQETLLKNAIDTLPIKDKSENTVQDHNNQLINKTYQLCVDIETRVNLQQITIKDVAQLKIGQIIPFLDRENAGVTVSINGKETYSCELGRIANNYTVRIKDKITFDQKNLKKIMHKE
ncbi:MAG: flagellar C-ring protein [Candidatus Liberibacter europaeus]|uniref:Flagellar motor switch protein FliM n=1 Tax=Candidatus Liberibacter europaeus TaxID=744859 RepID=A0A2T4VXN5_9HYPH|nr:flagellar C-ring protein [Candidatus Liberibacter europaeus]PTL86528.1 MAG: flagellar C-ring protein [Candidatus Liberibacter europaeus]